MKSLLFSSLILIAVFVMGCSSSNVSVKPDKTSDPITIEREIVASPPIDETYDQKPFYQMNDLIDLSVDNFYYCMERVPHDVDELLESGLILAIPKSPYNSKHYFFCQDVSQNDPAGISYSALGDKSYAYEFIVQKSDDLVKYTIVMEDDVWERRMYTEKADCADSKIQFLMELMP